jgi:hypothetical protein
VDISQHSFVVGERAWDAVFARQRRQPFGVAATQGNKVNIGAGAQAG